MTRQVHRMHRRRFSVLALVLVFLFAGGPPTLASGGARTVALTELGANRFGLVEDHADPGAGTGPSPSHTFEELLLNARMNELGAPHTMWVLRRGDGRLLARGEDLRYWRLRLPAQPALAHLDFDYYYLDELPGLQYRVNESDLSLELYAGAELFETTSLEPGMDIASPAQPSPPGAFFNYDVHSSHSHGDTLTGGLFELGLFNGKGVGIGTFQARDLGSGRDLVRLDTTWTRDMPERRASLRVGDTIGGTGAWGRAVRLGGVQWATNFATQPGFITFPMPGLSGEAALPSSLEVYVNDILRYADRVPTGPFSISDLPTITGQGEVRLVVRDLLGREQVITDRFYASPRILREGLHDYSYELGKVRENYGIESNDYGRWVATGTHRLGLSDRLTGEIRGEFLSGQQTVGAGAAFLWQPFGVVYASMAVSNSDRGQGGLLRVGVERSTRGVSFGFNTQLASSDFVQLGLEEDRPAPRNLTQAYVSWSIRRYGSVGLNYTRQAWRDRPNLETFGVNYNVSLGGFGYLGLAAVHVDGEESDTVFTLTLTRSLGRRTTGSASARHSRDTDELLMNVHKNLPVGSGYGYRVLAGALDSDRYEAGVSAQTDYGTYHFDVARFRGDTSYQATASGGLAWLGGRVHASRRITDSFAVVKVGEFENVRVLADNQVVSRTGPDGTALLPRLRAYEENPLRIEVADLPMDARIDGARLDAVPYFRSGLLIEFPVQRANGALVRILTEDGAAVPAGATVHLMQTGGAFPVGRDGEAYLTGLSEQNRLRVNWPGGSCSLELAWAASADPLPHLGTRTCHGGSL